MPCLRVTLVTCQSKIVPALVSCKPHFYVLLLTLMLYHTSVCFTNKFDWLIDLLKRFCHLFSCPAFSVATEITRNSLSPDGQYSGTTEVSGSMLNRSGFYASKDCGSGDSVNQYWTTCKTTVRSAQPQYTQHSAMWHVVRCRRSADQEHVASFHVSDRGFRYFSTFMHAIETVALSDSCF